VMEAVKQALTQPNFAGGAAGTNTANATAKQEQFTSMITAIKGSAMSMVGMLPHFSLKDEIPLFANKISLGQNAKYGVLEWRPWEFFEVWEIYAMGRAFLVWCAWLLFLSMIYKRCIEEVRKLISDAESWKGSSTVPGVSWGSTVGMASVMSVIMVAAITAIFAIVGGLVLPTLGANNSLDILQLGFAFSPAWKGVLCMADMMFPINLILGFVVTELICDFTLRGIASGALMACKFLIG